MFNLKSTSEVYTIEVPYAQPKRYGKRYNSGGIRWSIDVDNPIMRERAEKLMLLDPALPCEDVAGFVLDLWGNFLCRHCGMVLVFDGQNGSGTPSLLCNGCNKNMCIWNTYELTIWQYKKIQCALLHYTYGGTIQSGSNLYGVGKDALNEMKMCLPDIKYSRQGSIERIEYYGKEYGIITSDMMYKGQKGLMLGVSGNVEITEFGNENTGEGLEAFFSEMERTINTENYIFIMDKRINVAKMILERWKERVVVVLQNHSTWGDVSVCFYRDGWYTLSLRTDTFTEPSRKRNEASLLSVGEIEFHEGLKGVRVGTSLKDVAEKWLKDNTEELLIQLKNAEWKEKGRVDIVMRPKIQMLNRFLRELERREVEITDYLSTLRLMIDELGIKYGFVIKRSVKKKIVNAWRVLIILKEDVNSLSERLLKEPLPSKRKKKNMDKNTEIKEREVIRFLVKPKLVYRGKIDDPLVPDKAHWILGLLKKIFKGKEITTNPCEGRFGVIGMTIRQGRSIYLERAVTKVFLQKQDVGTTAGWLVGNYPISDMGKRGMRGTRTHLKAGRRYRVTYVNRRKEKSERIIDLIERKRKFIKAFCHLRGEILTFRRSRIKSITPI